jgi:hypothetical protein
MEVPTTANLDQFETKALLDLENRPAGTYRVKMMIRGNSLLSSVFVKSASLGASLQVNYFDTTTGDENVLERYDLNSHALLTAADAGKTNRIVVSRIHNKPQLEVIVVGLVEFGVYITAVSDFPVELNGNILDGQVANLALNGGVPIVTYDDNDNKFYLLRSNQGSISATLDGAMKPVKNPVNTTVLTDPVSDTETSFSLLAVKRYRMVNRGSVAIKYAYLVTQSGTNYSTIPPGGSHEEDNIDDQNITIYIQAPAPSQRLEVVSWS